MTEPAEIPHHCSPSDYVAMIARLQDIEAGALSPTDIDWRTQAGVLWRMLEYATRPTDASVDAFLNQFQERGELVTALRAMIAYAQADEIDDPNAYEALVNARAVIAKLGQI
jgi:hypothetical protein